MQLAKQLDVTCTHLSMIESGKREPSLGLANKLSRMTGIPIEKFVRKESARCG